MAFGEQLGHGQLQRPAELLAARLEVPKRQPLFISRLLGIPAGVFTPADCFDKPLM